MPFQSVTKLWDRLDRMERELRFQGRSYPTGRSKFPFRLTGQGFFPGGDGLWREEHALSAPNHGILPLDGTVFIGNDFGTLSGFTKLQKRGYENVPTWRHLKARITSAGIPREKTFFTNAILGLREEGPALGKSNWAADPDFAQFCSDFLQFQLEVLSPRLVVVMGPDAHDAYKKLVNGACHCRVLFARHPYGDFGLSADAKSRENEQLANQWAAL